jgi:hypothetical protein
LSLTTKAADVIPEFGCKGKHRVTIAQLLSHTAGMSAGLPPISIELIGNQEAMVTAICQMGVEAIPGKKSAIVRSSRTQFWQKLCAASTAQMGLWLHCHADQLCVSRACSLDDGRSRQGDGARFIKLGQTHGHY